MIVIINFLIILVNASPARVQSRLRANFFIFNLNICFHYFLLKLLRSEKKSFQTSWLKDEKLVKFFNWFGWCPTNSERHNYYFYHLFCLFHVSRKFSSLFYFHLVERWDFFLCVWKMCDKNTFTPHSLSLWAHQGVVVEVLKIFSG